MAWSDWYLRLAHMIYYFYVWLIMYVRKWFTKVSWSSESNVLLSRVEKNWACLNSRAPRKLLSLSRWVVCSRRLRSCHTYTRITLNVLSLFLSLCAIMYEGQARKCRTRCSPTTHKVLYLAPSESRIQRPGLPRPHSFTLWTGVTPYTHLWRFSHIKFSTIRNIFIQY